MKVDILNVRALALLSKLFQICFSFADFLYVASCELTRMATLVLDNGAYTAKIGYSLEKVR